MTDCRITIASPCTESWDSLQPTATGWHCRSCQAEVVNFTRMTDEEVLAYMAAHQGQRVCGFVAAPSVRPPRHQPKSGLRHWLLSMAAFFGWQYTAAAGLPPQKLPVTAVLSRTAEAQNPIIIQGVVLDDVSGTPVPGAYIFIAGTKYGVIANEKGEFTLSLPPLSLPPDWEPVQSGIVQLEIPRIPFYSCAQTVKVTVTGQADLPPLVVRLSASADRGMKGKARRGAAPVPLVELGQRER